jgi:uncharacterized membrane protein YkoI
MQGVILFLLLGLLPVFASADEGHEQARRLKEAGEILPLQQIIKKAQAEHPGRVIEVELGNEDGQHVYEVELLDTNGEVWELLLDAATGKLIKHERED